MEIQLICRKEQEIHMKNTNVTTENEELEMSEPTLQETIDKNIEALWKEFENVPVDRNGNLRAAWKAYPKGTNKNEVYEWFNRHHSKGLAYLMEEGKNECKEQLNIKKIERTVCDRAREICMDLADETADVN